MTYDIIIIGAGPAGISMAVEALSSGVPKDKVLVLEKASEHSFTIKKFYPDKKLVTANYKGFEAVCIGVMCIWDSSKSETITYLDEAIKQNGINVHYHETVWKLDKNYDTGEFTVITDKGEYKSKVTAIAIGILGKPNKPDYPIPATIKDKILFDVTSVEVKNSKVLVVGGGDSASEYCQYLSQEGNEVTLSYRRTDLKRMNFINRDSLLALEKDGKVKLHLGTDIDAVSSVEGKPAISYKGRDDVYESYDYIVYALGGTTPVNFLKLIGIEFNGPDPVLGEEYETNVPGLFLIGDLSAGTKGGSINWAFNSSRRAMQKICVDYLHCPPPAEDQQ
ncbi:MAG: NAD(P)-binding domain-containing protein [Ignavibacteriaceae bacterium]|nr:NAD(P)-binding domain-containing protein [Ignavibacteriaceae bacterium]